MKCTFYTRARNAHAARRMTTDHCRSQCPHCHLEEGGGVMEGARSATSQCHQNVTEKEGVMERT